MPQYSTYSEQLQQTRIEEHIVELVLKGYTSATELADTATPSIQAVLRNGISDYYQTRLPECKIVTASKVVANWTAKENVWLSLNYTVLEPPHYFLLDSITCQLKGCKTTTELYKGQPLPPVHQLMSQLAEKYLPNRFRYDREWEEKFHKNISNLMDMLSDKGYVQNIYQFEFIYAIEDLRNAYRMATEPWLKQEPFQFNVHSRTPNGESCIHQLEFYPIPLTMEVFAIQSSTIINDRPPIENFATKEGFIPAEEIYRQHYQLVLQEQRMAMGRKENRPSRR